MLNVLAHSKSIYCVSSLLLKSILINTIENQLIFTSMKNVLNRCDHFILYISSFIIIGMAFVARG